MRARLSAMRALRRLLRWLGRLILAFVVVSLALVTLYHYVDPPLTPLMLIRSVETGRKHAHDLWLLQNETLPRPAWRQRLGARKSVCRQWNAPVPVS